MKAALLVLLLALPARAEDVVVEDLPPPRVVLEVKDGYLRLKDDSTIQVTGGGYLPSMIAAAQEVADLKEENERLKRARLQALAPTSSGARPILIAAAFGFVAGVALTAWVVTR